MNVQEFKEFANASIDYLADYFENIRDRPVLSNVEPGYLSQALPKNAPNEPENWHNILNDIDKIIVPGLTHWHSPYFHAFFPTANSYPGIIGELFIAGLGTLTTNWESNPACVELETRVMDWLAKILGLPEYFQNMAEGPGGGVIQNAASDSTLVGILAAKHRKLKQLQQAGTELKEWEIRGKLVAYTSRESNSSVEKSGLLASIKMRLIQTDPAGSLRGKVLLETIQKDKNDGFIPFAVVATLGTTGTCAFDNLEEIGEICREERLWLHVDAAYAGTALACPEYRYIIKGIEYVDTFNFNPHKWMLVNADCSAMWFKNCSEVEDAFKIKPTLGESHQLPELEHWQIPDCRRFRSLKLWFVIRSYGIEGIQKHVRHQVALAKHLEHLVKSDERFQIIISSLGVVCFKLLGGETLTKKVLERIKSRSKIYIMPYYYQDELLFRFVVCSRITELEDINTTWKEITSQTTEVMKDCSEHDPEYKGSSYQEDAKYQRL
ncbi:aromatic-L-amino-acid decarboxylase-like [Cylas formicarius]|uniref:aromatic-L-amino-acid decarboxylase-like n=1 Tax=Cylas formicarius TaxID=197179 RepID=UPI0029586FE5|nr:aromatic-L-amino-acid decarboxylase-like [Cylas formicarius]